MIKYSEPMKNICEKICLILKVWMSGFLNIRSSRPQESCKKCVLKINILQDSLKNIHDEFSNLIKFQAKGLQLYWKETPAYMCSPKNFPVLGIPILQNTERLLLLKYLLKIKIAAPDKFSEAAICRYLSK